MRHHCFYKTLFLYLVKYVNRNISFLVIIRLPSSYFCILLILFDNIVRCDIKYDIGKKCLILIFVNIARLLYCIWCRIPDENNIVSVVNCIRSKTFTSSSEQLINTLINKHAVPFYVNGR